MDIERIIQAAPALELGQFAVVAMSTDGTLWNTGRTYATETAAAARQTREMNSNDCNAYFVKRHAAGITVYLAPSTVLGTVAR